MVKIVTDSSSDIPQATVEEFDITVIPARILFGSKVFLDGVDIDKEDFYKKLKSHRFHPLTTQASPFYIYNAVKHIETMGEDILFITLPTVLSKFQESGNIAFQNIRNVNWRIYDSTGTSMYQGLIVIQAAKLANLGYQLHEICDKLDLIQPRTITYAVANTLDYLIRGGRVPVTKGKIANLLKITPLLEINNSKVESISKPKGLDRAIAEILVLLKRQFNSDEPLLCSIMHAENVMASSTLTNAILENFNISELYNTKIGPTIGANIGPGAIGVSISPSIDTLVE